MRLYTIETNKGTSQMAKIRNRATREAVLKEYNHACAVCGCADQRSLQIDHVVPQSKGGADTIDNLQVLCYVCNTQIKGNTDTPRLKPRRKEFDCRKWERARRAFQAEINGIRHRARCG